MKFFTLALLAFVGFTYALEREQDFVPGEAESAPAEETTVRTPVTTVKPNVKDDDSDDDGDDDSLRPTECSNFLCSAMCRRSGCRDALCLPNNRCGCLCSRSIGPRDFFRRIFGDGYTPRFGHDLSRLFDFPTVPHFEDRFRDFSKLFETLDQNDGLSSKVYYTMQHTCEQAEDCSHVCTNCTTSNCVNNLCQCLTCSDSDAVESRKAGKPQKSCNVARECEEMCKGCVKVGCRYGNCQCGRCGEAKVTGPSTTTTTTTEAAITTASVTSAAPGARESSPVSIDVLQVRPSNKTRNDATLNGRCVPKRCNHACWERQCTKWDCIDDRCDCDGCPDDMAVIVRNGGGRAAKPEDSNKYEIIF